jgi:hypothetical protein
VVPHHRATATIARSPADLGSIGLTDARREPDAERLLLRADSALRRAKLTGRNRVVSDPG